MEIARDRYLSQLMAYRWDGQVKVVTGVRRCGKSFLLHTLFKNRLLAEGVDASCILSFELDLTRDLRYRNPLELASHVRGIAEGSPSQRYYLFIDEVQLSDEVENPYSPGGRKVTFNDALNDLRSLPNLDVYVTGSNSRMLSSDILTEFRGRADEVRMHPLNFGEFYAAHGGDKDAAFDDYAFYGGMPLVLSRPDESAKMEYLRSLFTEVYLKDIVERKRVAREDVLSAIVDLLCSSVGSLTNPTNVANTLNSRRKAHGAGQVSVNTVHAYMGYLEDAFLFSECKRYDVRGKSYFKYPNKYYCEDVGLRNARSGFRQLEMTHIMENIVYNELVARGYAVDVGVVYDRGRNGNGNPVRVPREIDFVAARGGKRIYIQSAYAMETQEKAASEVRPFSITGDSFPKVVVRHDMRRSWYDDNGVLNIGLIDFLLGDEWA